MSDDPSNVQRTIEATRDRVGQALDSITNASNISGRISDTLGDSAKVAKSKLEHGAGNLRGAVTRAGNRLPDPEPLRRSVQSPIALVVGAAAAGFIGGLILPLTDIERVRLEPIGEELAEWVADARDEAVEHGRQVVVETISAARDSAEKHGQELADTLKGGATEPESASSGGASTPPPQNAKSNVPTSSKTGNAMEPKRRSPDAEYLGSDEASQQSDGVKTREALEKSGVITPSGASHSPSR